MRMVVFVLLAFAFAAQTKPDFSEVWQLDLKRSTFRAQAPKEVLVKIDHRDPNLTQTMLIVAAGFQRYIAKPVTPEDLVRTVGGLWAASTSTHSSK
jgi:CheY-like chemotaxis protein